MKIVHLASYAVLSGPLPGVLLLAQAQAQAGHTVYIVHDAWRGNFSPYEEMARGYPPLAALAPPWPMVLSPKGGLIRAVRDVVRLRGATSQQGIDVVHCHLSHDHALAAWALQQRTALVRTVHAARAAQPRFGATWMWRRSHGFIARTASVAAAIEQRVPPRHRAPVHLIPGAINSATWAPTASAAAHRKRLRAAWGVPDNALVMGHVALMSRRGQEELLTAFSAVLQRLIACGHMPLPHLVFAGRGPQEVPLRWAMGTGRLAQHVHTVGYIPTAELPLYYAATDGAFVAQPGNDGAARAALEAMAAGVPLVAVDCPALAQVLRPHTAFLASSRTPEAIACALRAWHQSPEGRGQRLKQAQSWVRAERGPAQEARATLEVYDQARRLAAP